MPASQGRANHSLSEALGVARQFEAQAEVGQQLCLTGPGDGLAGISQDPDGFPGEGGALGPVCHGGPSQHDSAVGAGLGT